MFCKLGSTPLEETPDAVINSLQGSKAYVTHMSLHTYIHVVFHWKDFFNSLVHRAISQSAS